MKLQIIVEDLKDNLNIKVIKLDGKLDSFELGEFADKILYITAFSWHIS